MLTLQLRYFARLREQFGCDTETLKISATSVSDVVSALINRGGVWSEALNEGRIFRVAVNQEMVTLNAPVGDGDEIAIFPPVTGG